MLEWVEHVLKPYVATAPKDVVPILLLDQYKCHLMASVVNKIEDLGVQVEHIPAGVTGLCQPVDVGVNKPFKNYILRQWEEYMIEKGLRTVIASPPDRLEFAQWIINSKAQLTKQVVKNSWRHAPYSYFPSEPSVHDRGATDDSPTDAFAYGGNDDGELDDDDDTGIIGV